VTAGLPSIDVAIDVAIDAGTLLRAPRRLAAVLLIGAALGGCTFGFGEDPGAGSPEERWKESRRRYQQEIELMERQKQIIDPIPSER
jgi:hypothetical protein